MSEETKDEQEQPKVPDVLPVLPLRDIVIFPFMIVPLYVSRDRSIRAVDQALAENRMILLAAQKKQDEDDPGAEDIYPVGTAALIMRMLKLPDGRIRVLVQGLSRARIVVLRRGPAAPAGARRDGRRAGERPRLARGRGHDAQRQGRAREVAEPRQADLARGDRDRQQHGGAGPARRPDGLQPRPQGRGRAGDPRGARPGREAAPRPRAHDQGARGAHDAAGDLLAGQGGDGQEPARVLPAPAAEGDPVGARRGQRARRGDRAAAGEGHQGQDAEAGAGGGGAPAQEARAHAPRRGRDGDLAQLARLDGDAAVGQGLEGQPRPRGGAADPGRGPLRPREGEGAHRRVPGGAQAQGEGEGAALVLRRPARRRQDQPRPLDRAGARAQVRAALARRRQGRGRDPRPSAHLRGLDAGPHHPGHPPGGRQQPRVHDGRGGQDRRRLPRRPELGAARGARPRAEQRLPRPLPGRAVRPLERDVHLHREPDRHDPAGVPRPHGADPALGLHRGREARDRQAPPGAQAARGARPLARESRVHGPGAQGHRQQLHARGGPAELRARDRAGLAQGGAQGGRRARRRRCG